MSIITENQVMGYYGGVDLLLVGLFVSIGVGVYLYRELS